jgi:thymidylate kinase
MIVIFEGADGVGKTTAVNTFVEVLRQVEDVEPLVLHRGPPTRDPLLEYTVDLERYGMHDTRAWAVCDRWHWGELIYGPLYRGTSLLSGAGHRAIDEFLARRGACIIHMDQTWNVVLQRVQERGDDYVKEAHLPFILDRYREVREMDSPLPRQTVTDFDERSARTLIRTMKTVAAARG